MFILNIYAEDINTEKSDINSVDKKEEFNASNSKKDISAYDLGIIIEVVRRSKENTNEEKKIEEIESKIKSIVKEINDEKLVDFDEDKFLSQTNYLKNKININSKYDNLLAIKRDEIKIKNLQLQKTFALTINKIIKGKKTLKDKKYFISILEKALKSVKSIDLKAYEKTYQSVVAHKDPVSTAFVQEYETLTPLIKSEIFIFEYLKNNINSYRKSNIFLDGLSLDYLIKKIDSIPGIAQISEIMSYYLKISIGQILVIILIFLLTILFNRNVIPRIGEITQKVMSKRFGESALLTYDYSHSGFKVARALIVYTFAIQLSTYLVVDNLETLKNMQAWYNTTYISLLSYISYNFMINYINVSSDKIFNQYPNMRKEMIDFLLRIVKIVILVFIVLFLLMQLGFDIKAIIASLGIGGIAVALASKDTLSNFFGSLNIITDNSFSQGDWIQAGSIEGTVVDIRMRTTRIRTFANAMITVPNAELANMAITNWSKRKIGRRIKMTLNITYSSKMSDIQNLARDIKDMLSEHKGIASNKTETTNLIRRSNLLKQEDLMGIKKTLLVFVDEYNSSSIDIMIYCFSKSPDWETWLEVKEDVIVKINDLVIKNNCEFAYPSQTVYLENEEKE